MLVTAAPKVPLLFALRMPIFRLQVPKTKEELTYAGRFAKYTYGALSGMKRRLHSHKTVAHQNNYFPRSSAVPLGNGTALTAAGTEAAAAGAPRPATTTTW